MRRSLYFILLAVWFALFNVQAQDYIWRGQYELYSSTQKRFTFTIQPMQCFNSALRFDFETRLGEGPGWLQFGPTVYYRKKSRQIENPHYFYVGNDYQYNDSYYDFSLHGPFSKMKGEGLDINYKRFVNPYRSFYVAAGLSYTHFKVDYWGYGWDDFIEDNLQYHTYKLDYRTQQINRTGVNAIFGYQIPTRNAFICDMFLGLAYRHSFSDKNKPLFNRSMVSYGYSGLVFLTGVRFGFGIK